MQQYWRKIRQLMFLFVFVDLSHQGGTEEFYVLILFQLFTQTETAVHTSQKQLPHLLRSLHLRNSSIILKDEEHQQIET